MWGRGVWGVGEVWASSDLQRTTASGLLDCLCPLANAAPGFNYRPRTALGRLGGSVPLALMSSNIRNGNKVDRHIQISLRVGPNTGARYQQLAECPQLQTALPPAAAAPSSDLEAPRPELPRRQLGKYWRVSGPCTSFRRSLIVHFNFGGNKDFNEHICPLSGGLLGNLGVVLLDDMEHARRPIPALPVRIGSPIVGGDEL